MSVQFTRTTEDGETRLVLLRQAGNIEDGWLTIQKIGRRRGTLVDLMDPLRDAPGTQAGAQPSSLNASVG